MVERRKKRRVGTNEKGKEGRMKVRKGGRQ